MLCGNVGNYRQGGWCTPFGAALISDRCAIASRSDPASVSVLSAQTGVLVKCPTIWAKRRVRLNMCTGDACNRDPWARGRADTEQIWVCIAKICSAGCLKGSFLRSLFCLLPNYNSLRAGVAGVCAPPAVYDWWLQAGESERRLFSQQLFVTLCIMRVVYQSPFQEHDFGWT